MTGGIIFLIGAVGFILFVVLHTWEVKSNKRLFADFRNGADAVVSRTYKTMVLGEVPHEYRVQFQKWIRNSVHKILVFLARILRAIERPLSRLGHRVREVDIKNGGREPSSYLKTLKPSAKSTPEKDGKVDVDSV